MAGRIRTLKPEILDDAATARLSANAHRLFVGLILIADDHGNARADATYLRGAVFHSAPDAPDDIDALVAELARKLVEVYVDGDERYIHMRGWAKHQRISNAGEPRVPLPPGWTLEPYEKHEGNRVRKYARSIPPTVARNGAAPGSIGAAPISSGLCMEEIGAAGSPITDPDHRSPTTSTGGAAPPPTPTPDPGDPALTETEAAVLAELEVFADLWPTEKPRARMYTAIRVARAVDVEPACKRDGLDAPAVVRLALPKVRTWASGLTHTSDRQRLAKVDEAVAWILGDVRKGRYRQAPNAAEKSRPSGGELDEIKQRQRRVDREEAEKIAAANKRKAIPPSEAATLIGNAIANLGKPAPAKGAA